VLDDIKSTADTKLPKMSPVRTVAFQATSDSLA